MTIPSGEKGTDSPWYDVAIEICKMQNITIFFKYSKDKVLDGMITYLMT